MKHELPALDSLKAFEASARHLSFSLAADELCLSNGAVSYQIQKLESHLGCKLFNRTVRQVYLTEAGQELFITTQAVFNTLKKQLGDIKSGLNKSEVSLSVSTYAAVRWLSPNIAEFIEKHPAISIALHHSVNSKNFQLSDVDLALRWGECKGEEKPDSLAEATLPIFPVCSPKLLERFGYHAKTQFPIETMTQSPWCDIPLLCEDRPEDYWQEWSKNLTAKLSNQRRVIGDSNVRVQAAVDGQGWMLADELMANELDNYLLVNPFNECLVGYGYTLLRQPSQAISQEVQLLSDWLAEKLTQTSKNLRYP